jgi:outer membrane protein assembly factor BamA
VRCIEARCAEVRCAEVRCPIRVLAFGLALLLACRPAFAQQGVIASIRVQGNTLTPDEEIVRASGLSEGQAFSDELLVAAADRLRAAKRFESVEVLKRYASIADPQQILVLIRVGEGPVRVVAGILPGQTPRVVRRSKLNLMVVPILDAEDGYGLTYGAQLAVTGSSSTTSRVVFPLSWGGDKRAGAEFQKEFAPPLAPRVAAGGFVQRRTHPFFHSDAERTRVRARAEWTLFSSMRAGTEIAWQKATLLQRTDTTRSVGADIVLDTRRDSMLPRNAVYTRLGIDRLNFDADSRPLMRMDLEAAGYLGMYRGSVLVLRALRQDMSRSAPPYFKSILGGAENLRGFRAGTAIGDTLAAGSAEVRIPLSSPLNLAKFGTSVFIDVGTTYDKGQRFRDRDLKRGVGAGVWATAALFRISVMVAHGIGHGTRVHFGAGLTF